MLADRYGGPMSDEFAAYAAAHAIELTSLDPAASLDDLEPLLDVFGSARVIGIGESSHFVSEYYRLRHRLLRLLAQRGGFTVFALESGFSEGLAVDAWLRGGPGDPQDLGRDAVTYRMGRCPEFVDFLEWMRPAGVRFCGLDIPGGTGSLLPALDHLAGFLRRVDPDALGALERASVTAEKYASEHTLLAYGAYAALDSTERDELTALLAELAARFDALEPEYSADPMYPVVRHELRLAVLGDQALRSYAGRIGGQITHPKVSARDRGLAETVFWLLDRYGPDAKIVLGAANSHLQRTPVVTPEFALSGAGHQLAHRLGDEYLSVAVTATAGQTTGRRADPEAAGGVAVFAADLEPPVPGSVEAGLTGFKALDLRPARGGVASPDRSRVGESWLGAPVLDAYDAVINVPHTSVTAQIHAW
jgi:erythromycin esterase